MSTGFESTSAPQVDQTLHDLVREGKSALERGEIPATLARFEEIVGRWPEYAEGHNDLGSLYATLGRHDEAEARFSRVLELMPGTPNVLYNRGIVRIRRERWAEAVADFEMVLEACPDDADCWNNLGVACYLSGNYAASITHFLKALDLTPYFPNALLNYVDAAVATGDTESALGACRDFLQYRDNEAVRRREIELTVGAIEGLLEKACDSAVALDRRHPGDRHATEQHRRLLAARSVLAGHVLSGSADA